MPPTPVPNSHEETESRLFPVLLSTLFSLFSPVFSRIRSTQYFMNEKPFFLVVVNIHKAVST
jgi:hypothetical protein